MIVDDLADQTAVLKHDGALGGFGHLRIVGDDDQGGALPVQLAEEPQHNVSLVSSRLPVGSSARMISG